MPRTTIVRAQRDTKSVDIEIACLRDLDVKELRVRWHTEVGREAPSHLPRHLLFRILAYRLQAEGFGDLSEEHQRRLNRFASRTAGDKRLADQPGLIANVPKGTILGREWKSRMHRVAVLADGFAWNGKTYPSLSKIAFAITGTHWNGPRFFGLRDKPKPASGVAQL
jgi:hypothetical protein